MNNRQYKDRFLRSKVNECLHNAATEVQYLCHDKAIEHLVRALAFARQLPVNQKNRAQRAYIVTAIDALQRSAYVSLNS